MSPRAAQRAQAALKEAIESLAEFPDRGRPGSLNGSRELVVPFGRQGYVLRYRVEGDHVIVSTIRHTREDR